MFRMPCVISVVSLLGLSAADIDLTVTGSISVTPATTVGVGDSITATVAASASSAPGAVGTETKTGEAPPRCPTAGSTVQAALQVVHRRHLLLPVLLPRRGHIS